MKLLFLFVGCTWFSSFATGKGLAVNRSVLQKHPGGLDLSPFERFTNVDSSHFAAADYDDANWPQAPRADATGPGWCRIHLIFDQTIENQAISLKMRLLGAAEIFFDGALIKSYGSLAPLHPTFYQPQDVPFVLCMAKAGDHVICIRLLHAGTGKSGCAVKIGTADEMIAFERDKVTFYVCICALIIGIFFTMSFTHIPLFIYMKKVRAHLYFAVFSLAMAGTFISPFLASTGHQYTSLFYIPFLNIFTCALFCIGISYLIYDLFGISKTVPRWVAGSSLALLAGSLINVQVATLCFTGLVFYTFFDALVTTSRAMIRRVPYAKIIGIGLILFVIYIIIVSIIKISYGLNNEDFATDSSGFAFMIVTFCFMLCPPVSMSIFLSKSFATANESLARSNKNLQQLISYNAHQIREPLTRITGALSIREYMEGPEFINEMLPLIDKAANDLDTAVKDIIERSQAPFD